MRNSVKVWAAFLALSLSGILTAVRAQPKADAGEMVAPSNLTCTLITDEFGQGYVHFTCDGDDSYYWYEYKVIDQDNNTVYQMVDGVFHDWYYGDKTGKFSWQVRCADVDMNYSTFEYTVTVAGEWVDGEDFVIDTLVNTGNEFMVESNGISGINLYPNPCVGGEFHLEIPVDATVEILNASGCRIAPVAHLHAGDHLFRLNNVTSGLYFARITGLNGKTSVKRIVVR